MSELQAKETAKSPPQQNTRNERLKEIDALYRSQLRQIHSEGKNKINLPEKIEQPLAKIEPEPKKIEVKPTQQGLSRVKSSGSFLTSKNIQSSKLIGDRDNPRASTFLRGDATRTIELLRHDNQTKELKIRQLANRCQGLIDKLKQLLPEQDAQRQLQNLREISSDRSERLQRLFKIKTQQVFFKLKLQVVSLLQDFGVARDSLSQSNDLKSESELFAFLSKKLKERLKEFRSKEAETTFSLQKDRILNQKHEERIHFLTETNELLKLSQNKLKGKVQDLKNQLNEYIDRLRTREEENQERQNEYFRLKKQNQELQAINHKLSTAARGAQSEKSEERREWQARERQLKQLLTSYNVDKRKLEGQIQELQGHIEEQLIRLRFLQQENERLSRQLVRWKERFEGLQREKQLRMRQLQQQKNMILSTFQEYKLNHNEGVSLQARNEVHEALKQVEEYQIAYQQVLEQLQDQRRLLQRCEQQSQERLQLQEKQWLARVKKLEQTKEADFKQFMKEAELRHAQLKEQYQHKENLLVEQLQARLKAQLAERDKLNTEQLINIESQNDELRREIESLNKLLEVKQSLINVLNGKKSAFQ